LFAVRFEFGLNTFPLVGDGLDVVCCVVGVVGEVAFTAAVLVALVVIVLSGWLLPLLLLLLLLLLASGLALLISPPPRAVVVDEPETLSAFSRAFFLFRSDRGEMDLSDLPEENLDFRSLRLDMRGKPLLGDFSP
jgi:hypothetical protein